MSSLSEPMRTDTSPSIDSEIQNKTFAEIKSKFNKGPSTGKDKLSRSISKINNKLSPRPNDSISPKSTESGGAESDFSESSPKLFQEPQVVPAADETTKQLETESVVSPKGIDFIHNNSQNNMKKNREVSSPCRSVKEEEIQFVELTSPSKDYAYEPDRLSNFPTDMNNQCDVDEENEDELSEIEETSPKSTSSTASRDLKINTTFGPSYQHHHTKHTNILSVPLVSHVHSESDKQAREELFPKRDTFTNLTLSEIEDDEDGNKLSIQKKNYIAKLNSERNFFHALELEGTSLGAILPKDSMNGLQHLGQEDENEVGDNEAERGNLNEDIPENNENESSTTDTNTMTQKPSIPPPITSSSVVSNMIKKKNKKSAMTTIYQLVLFCAMMFFLGVCTVAVSSYANKHYALSAHVIWCFKQGSQMIGLTSSIREERVKFHIITSSSSTVNTATVTTTTTSGDAASSAGSIHEKEQEEEEDDDEDYDEDELDDKEATTGAAVQELKEEQHQADIIEVKVEVEKDQDKEQTMNTPPAVASVKVTTADDVHNPTSAPIASSSTSSSLSVQKPVRNVVVKLGVVIQTMMTKYQVIYDQVKAKLHHWTYWMTSQVQISWNRFITKHHHKQQQQQ